MTKAQTKIINTLYKQLMQLCGESETFFFVDQVTVMGTPVRIFNYRMASYTDWLKPGALECRGIMFEMDGDTPYQSSAALWRSFLTMPR
ncbi:RNA ligase 1 and tail fiber attachment catalyst [Klebsiella phage CPRSA]|nr:RNA ligase 1 and tail fiber attachment catalyst [Klebsiella phage CPRSA]